jgi:hypothetical protein
VEIDDAPCGQAGTCSGTFVLTGSCLNFPDPKISGQFDYFGGTNCGPQPADAGAYCNAGTVACNQSVVVGPATVDGGSCAPGPKNPNRPPVTWGSTGQACGGATPGTGCGGTSTCLPIPAGAFHSGVCIMQDGEQPCPAGQFADQHVFYSGKTDTRDCTDCTCAAPTGSSCTAQVNLYQTSPTCTGALLTADAGTCTPLSGNPRVFSILAQTTHPSGGTCVAIDGQPMGTVTPTGPTTFCCIP